MGCTKKAIIVGAAGFVGYHLTKFLSENGYEVYAFVRPGSNHNYRLMGMAGVHIIDMDVNQLFSVDQCPPCDVFFQLAWGLADRYDYEMQMRNAYVSINLLELAARLGCKRFVGIGSQAEYGISTGIVAEDINQVSPFCGYGAAKVATCFLTKQRASELGIEWVWGRIFSVYGKYEPMPRIIPYIFHCIREKETIKLSSCTQYWDFLYATDAATALVAMAEKGRNNEIYNIANGGYRVLRDFVEEIAEMYGYKEMIFYGDRAEPFISLQPSVDKLVNDTGWTPKMEFIDGIVETYRG